MGFFAGGCGACFHVVGGLCMVLVVTFFFLQNPRGVALGSFSTWCGAVSWCVNFIREEGHVCSTSPQPLGAICHHTQSLTVSLASPAPSPVHSRLLLQVSCPRTFAQAVPGMEPSKPRPLVLVTVCTETVSRSIGSAWPILTESAPVSSVRPVQGPTVSLPSLADQCPCGL